MRVARSSRWQLNSVVGLALVVVLGIVTGSQVLGPPPALAWKKGQLEITFVNVDGDAALYRGPCGDAALIDASGNGVKHLREVVGTQTLQWILVSHYDFDHIGGVVAVGASLAPGEVVYDRGGGPAEVTRRVKIPGDGKVAEPRPTYARY